MKNQNGKTKRTWLQKLFCRYDGMPVGRSLIPALCLSLAISFLVMLYGPLELFFTNVHEFYFGFGMLFPVLLKGFIVMLAALVLIVGLWNGVRAFWPAYGQALLFLEIMNWYDGIVIDRLWVGHSAFWIIPGTEDIPFVQTWPQVLKKRGILTLIWIVGASIVAGLVVLIG